MNLSKKYWIAILCKIIVILSTLLISIFINRGLGVQVKGEYAYIINFVEILYIVGGIGLGEAYSMFKKEELNNRNTFVLLSITQGIAVFIIGCLLCSLININYGMIITVLTSFAVIRANLTIISVVENSIKRNIISTAVNVFYLILLINLYFINKCNLNTVLICYGLNEIIRCIIFIYIYKMPPRLEKISIIKLKKIYSIGILTMIITLLISVNYSIDTIMLKYMTNSYNVGIYSVGVTFSNIFLLIPDAFKEVLFGDSSNENFSRKTIFSAIKVSFIASSVILIGFILFGKFAIKLLYGIDYINAFGVTLIIFIGSLSMIFFKILQPIYIVEGKQKKAICFLVCSAIVNIILNIMLIPKYGYYGTAIASAISYTVCGGLFFFDYLREYKIMIKK